MFNEAEWSEKLWKYSALNDYSILTQAYNVNKAISAINI